MTIDPTARAAKGSGGAAGATRGVGTVMYAAPEQRARSNYSSKADIYSLGVVLVEMLGCSRGAGHTDSERVAIISAARERLEMPEPMVRRYPRLAGLARSLLAHDPGDRPAARELMRTWVLPATDGAHDPRRSTSLGRSVPALTVSGHLRGVARTRSMPSEEMALLRAAASASAPNSPADASEAAAAEAGAEAKEEGDDSDELRKLKMQVAALTAEVAELKGRAEVKSQQDTPPALDQ